MKKVVLLLLVFLFVSCSLLMVRSNKYYTKQEFKLIEKSAVTVNLGFGFDSRINLNYFYIFKNNSKSILLIEQKRSLETNEEQITAESSTSENDNKEGGYSAQYAAAIAAFPDDVQFYLLTKVYYLYERSRAMKDHYKSYKVWTHYNIIKLEYLPALAIYRTSLEEYMKQEKSSLYNDFLQQKEDIRIDAITEVQKEFNVVDEY